MSILLIIVNDPVYFISHRLPIAEAARDSGYSVHVASIASPVAIKVIELGFTYHELHMRRGGVNPLEEIYSVFSFWRLLVKIRPDILHLVTTKPVLYGGLAARFSSVKGVVAAIAGLGSIFLSQSIKFKILRMLVCQMYSFALGKKNLRAIFQNPDDRNTMIKIGALDSSKTVLIRGSGVRLNAYDFREEPAGKVVVTFAGRLLHDKGVIEFIEAADLLLSKNVSAIFQLVGDVDDGNPSSLSVGEVSALSLKKNVFFMGHRHDIAEIFYNSNLVVLPSYREGLPKVLLEAAACGRAVVTTDVAGCRDAIEPDVTGLLVPVRDHVALANAIELLIKNPDLRRRMGAKGRDLAEREFTIENVIQAHLNIYKELEDNV
ncbi:Glycosyltransferase involved in cell wall bisynthesis [Pseudomonas cuatrocienegasensis]|uniref:Glycosyltransferase involved in cell wall bisynthesis n=1 Tax=Pseudomonas cuatrocienegasensis TaxID=543360 RepID=A0ABY1B9R3_9PSED|nr:MULTISPECIES: glycosyltransferase family 4 protein [Pseudomonas]OEC35318.1 glycosyl transferase family 1 [Pseudomonas sp. 21C1]SEQ31917.1 Glycosyltransferase involved in cell wall bisynthesis [Pseudomonas cuatrocienegasensis]